MMAKCVKRMITERCGCAVDYRWMNVRMRERGIYCSKEKRVKKLESQQRRERVRHRRRESFLQPATRDITVFLLRGFSLVKKKGFVCLSVCVSVCAKLSRNMLTPPGMPSALLSSSALLHDVCLFLLMTFFFCGFIELSISFLPFFFCFFFTSSSFPCFLSMCPSSFKKCWLLFIYCPYAIRSISLPIKPEYL